MIDADTLADSNAIGVFVSANLQQYKDGVWTMIKNWTNDQEGSYTSISKTWYVSSGYLYRLVTEHTTYFSGKSESTTLTSRNVSY